MSDQEKPKPWSFTFDAGDIFKLDKGTLSVIAERRKQETKHGFTGKWQAEHPEYYVSGQLVEAATELLKIGVYSYDEEEIYSVDRVLLPYNWDKAGFIKLCEKSQKDRMRIAAALLAAELDRLNYLENNI